MRLGQQSVLAKWVSAALFALVGATNVALATPEDPGSIDATWAPLSPYGAGKLITVVSASFDEAHAMAIQPDGKIVVAGSCGNDVCAVRHNADGSLDVSFNGTGSVTFRPVGTTGGIGNAVAIQSDGKIVIGGWCINSSPVAPRFCALRYNANGSLDSGFNGSGQVITDAGGSDNRANAIAMQGDGKIVLAGTCAQSFCAVRYNADGSLDTTFNVTGKVVTPNTGDANALTVQADGKIVLAGSCRNVSGSCVARYNANGTLDTGFNGTGTLAGVAIGYVQAVAIQADGKIVLAGGCVGFCAARLHANGSVDSGFNGTGVSASNLSAGVNGARALAIQADGRMLLAGFCRDASNRDDFCVLRYNTDGSLDSSFNASNISLRGTAVTPVGSLNDIAYAAAIQTDGKILLAGTCEIPTAQVAVGLAKMCTVRYEGGPFSAQNCKLDIDGDNRILATTDSLIHARIARGMTGDAVVAGINFPAEATRKTWPAIRAFLVTQCGMSLPP